MGKTKELQEDVQKEQREQSSSLQRSRPYGLATQSPFSFMRRFSEEMDRLFDDFSFRRGSSGFPTLRHREFEGAWFPQVEMQRRDNQLVVRADLPGLKKEDIQVEVDDNNCLTIRGERRKDWKEEDERGGLFHSERSYGTFYRCIELPRGTNPNSINATFQDGVLEVTVPTPQTEQPSGRRIEVRG
jgi:HSP20 family protein